MIFITVPRVVLLPSGSHPLASSEMSRRARRRGRTRAAGGAWAPRIAIGLILGSVVAAALLFAAIRGYLHSDGFRQFLSAKASRAAGVDGRFSPFRWDGLAVNTDAFEASGGGAIRKLKVEGMHTEVGLGGLTRGFWELRESRVRRLEAWLAAGDGPAGPTAAPTAVPGSAAASPGESGWLPEGVLLAGLDVQEILVGTRLEAGPLTLRGMRLRAEPAGPRGAYAVETSGGTVALPYAWVPELRLSNTRSRWQDGRLYLQGFEASLWGKGRLEGTGEWDSGSRGFTVEGEARDVTCADLFNDDWAKRFTGDVVSDFTVAKPGDGGTTIARGHLAISRGILTALPVLDTLAAYADTSRFRVIHLSEAATDWSWRRDEWRFTKLVIASEGLVRLQGDLTLRGRELDGRFLLGLAPGTLASIPGAETAVFVRGDRGLMWAPLRITGSLDDPQEDLSERLVAAAGARMFEVIPATGEKVLRFSRGILGQAVGEAPAKVVEQGVEAVGKGVDVVRQGAGLVGGLLGVDPAPESEPPPRKDPP